MPDTVRLAAAAGLAILALGSAACTEQPAEDEAADATASATATAEEATSVAAEDAAASACDLATDGEAGDPALAAIVGDAWAGVDETPWDVDEMQPDTICIDADGDVAVTTIDDEWTGTVTLGEADTHLLELESAEGESATWDLTYLQDDDTIGVVESGDDGKWFTYTRG